MAYNILSIRTPTDEPDPLYPSIGNGGKTVTISSSIDGQNLQQFSAVELSVWELQEDDNKFHRLGHFGGTSHTLFLTDCRTIVFSPNFKKGDASYLMFDMPGFYLVSALTAAIKTHNRALTGQVMHYNVFKLSVVGTGRRRETNRIRLYLRDETEGSERQIFLQITFRVGTDPRPLAQQIARRIAGYWLQPNMAKTLERERKATLAKLANPPLLEPTGEVWRSYEFPFSAGVVLKGQDRPIHKVPATTRAERFASIGDISHPPFRWLDFSAGTPPLPSEWGIRFKNNRGIAPSDSGAKALIGSCNLRAMYLVDRASQLPVESNGQRQVLYAGWGMYVIVGNYLITLLMRGNTLIGPVEHEDDAGRVITATRLEDIGSIAVTSLVLERYQGVVSLVDKETPTALAVFPRNRAWGTTWITDSKELMKGDNGSKLEPLTAGALAEQLVFAVTRATGSGTPARRELASGYLYDLAGDLDGPTAGGGQSGAMDKCTQCGLGEGPRGYPCLACGGTSG